MKKSEVWVADADDGQKWFNELFDDGSGSFEHQIQNILGFYDNNRPLWEVIREQVYNRDNRIQLGYKGWEAEILASVLEFVKSQGVDIYMASVRKNIDTSADIEQYIEMAIDQGYAYRSNNKVLLQKECTEQFFKDMYDKGYLQCVSGYWGFRGDEKIAEGGAMGVGSAGASNSIYGKRPQSLINQKKKKVKKTQDYDNLVANLPQTMLVGDAQFNKSTIGNKVTYRGRLFDTDWKVEIEDSYGDDNAVNVTIYNGNRFCDEVNCVYGQYGQDFLIGRLIPGSIWECAEERGLVKTKKVKKRC